LAVEYKKKKRREKEMKKKVRRKIRERKKEEKMFFKIKNVLFGFFEFQFLPFFSIFFRFRIYSSFG